ncbi:MAG: amidohydrolase family protein [Chloroflexi bacterium]|nr:amidohydrolase family protein [Chloroflexota bacterium]
MTNLDFSSFANLPILDGHTHVWAGFEPQLLWETLQQSGARRCNALSVGYLPVTDPAKGTLNDEVLKFKSLSNNRAYGFGALDYTAHFHGEGLRPDDLVAQVSKLEELGFDGVKMWEGKPSVYVLLPDRLEEPLYAPFFAWMEERRFPLLMHLADAPRFWDPSRVGLDPWSFADSRYPTRVEMYAELERILDRHPRLVLILAHFLFLWNELDEAARLLDRHPSVAFDLTPAVEGYVQLSQNAGAAREFFIRYQDRLIYGTDVGAGPVVNPAVSFDKTKEAGQPWLVRTWLESTGSITLPSGVGAVTNQFVGKRLRGIALPLDVLEKIYWRNFERMVGSKPRESTHNG